MGIHDTDEPPGNNAGPSSEVELTRQECQAMRQIIKDGTFRQPENREALALHIHGCRNCAIFYGRKLNTA